MSGETPHESGPADVARPSNPSLVSARDLVHTYPGGPFRLEVDRLDVQPGQAVAVVGPSGCGKTTLLNLLAGIDPVQQGTVHVAGYDLSAGGKLSGDEGGRRRFRRHQVGLVFQELELLEHLTAGENILLPYLIASDLMLTAEVRAHAKHLADAAGIGALLARRPRRLSQGERQRVALCRALVTRPHIVLADEPTGNLDPDTTTRALDLMLEGIRGQEAALLMATHDHTLLDRFDAVIPIGATAASA